MAPFETDENKERTLFSLATELGLIDLGECINSQLAKDGDQEAQALTRTPVSEDYSRLT